MNSEKEIEIKRLARWGSVALALLGLFLLVSTLGAFKDWRGGSENPNTISVVGEGEVYTVADIATFSFSVSAEAANVTEAQNKVTAKMNATLEALKNLGIEEKDIKTTNYYVSPKYTYEPIVCSQNYCPPGRQVPDGFTVSHDVTVKVRKTDDAGRALALVGENGATNVSGLSFTTDDPTALYDEARAKAIDNATNRAEKLAKDLGVKLVRVVSFSENDGRYPMPMYDAKNMSLEQAGSAAPSLPIGENKIVSNVTVVYEIR